MIKHFHQKTTIMRTTLLCILLMLTGILSAQTIDNPPFKARSGSIINITRIERTPESTRIYDMPSSVRTGG